MHRSNLSLSFCLLRTPAGSTTPGASGLSNILPTASPLPLEEYTVSSAGQELANLGAIGSQSTRLPRRTFSAATEPRGLERGVSMRSLSTDSRRSGTSLRGAGSLLSSTHAPQRSQLSRDSARGHGPRTRHLSSHSSSVHQQQLSLDDPGALLAEAAGHLLVRDTHGLVVSATQYRKRSSVASSPSAAEEAPATPWRDASFTRNIQGFPLKLLEAIVSALMVGPTQHVLLDTAYSGEPDIPSLMKALQSLFALSVDAAVCSPDMDMRALCAPLPTASPSALGVNERRRTFDRSSLEPESRRLGSESSRRSTDDKSEDNGSDSEAGSSVAEAARSSGALIFSNIFIVQGLDRAPLHVQAVLLQAMKTRLVTIDGTLHYLPKVHVIIATHSSARCCVPRTIADGCMLEVLLEPDTFARLRAFAASAHDTIPWRDLAVLQSQVKVSDVVGQYLRDVVVAARQHGRVAVGPSPQAVKLMLMASK